MFKKIKAKLFLILKAWALNTIKSRDHDQVIYNGLGEPYLLRWKAVRIYGIFNVYIHQFVADDDKRALHDHPWPSLSLLVSGNMYEYFPKKTLAILNPRTDCVLIKEGSFKYRSAKYTHRIELLANAQKTKKFPVTIFVTGPKTRAWGFYTPDGWVHWKDYFGVEK